MIKAIRFQNYKVLKNTTLPLQKFTLIIGPNGSGKSTAVSALRNMIGYQMLARASVVSAGAPLGEAVSIRVQYAPPDEQYEAVTEWHGPDRGAFGIRQIGPMSVTSVGTNRLVQDLQRVRVYSLEAEQLASSVQPQPEMALGERGDGLAGVLDRLRDQFPERFQAFTEEFTRWLPEFDRVLFDTVAPGQKAIFLRTSLGKHRIPASALSQGTLLALGILTVAYQPDPPPVVAFEEPDRGIHPRLLHDVRDAMYRLAYPEDYSESRPAVQVIATTHSPYMVDLFRDHLGDVVIAEKQNGESKFESVASRPDVNKILEESHLGEAWYTGVLGGVPPK